MEPDDYQQAWRADASETRVTVDADALLEAVRRDQQQTRAEISLNDFGELAILALLLPVWIGLGIATASPWSWYLMVPALLWGAAYRVAGRMRRRRTPSDPAAPLRNSVKESLNLIEARIRSSRDAFRWSQLPMATAMLAFFLHISWLNWSHDWPAFLGFTALLVGFVFAVYGSVYYANRRIVRRRLEPKRQELIALLAGLSEEPADEVSGAFPLLMGGERAVCTRRRMVAGSLCALAILVIGVPAILYAAYSYDQDQRKRAPFTDVRWGGDRPVVKIDDAWHVLFAIDGLDVKNIVAYSQRTYGDKWRKRFAEDLADVLAGMGHAPNDTVRLDVLSVGPPAERTTKDVAMTVANRRALRAAAEQREARQPPPRPAVSIGDLDASRSLEEALETIRAAYDLPALAAFTLHGDIIVEQAAVGRCSAKGDAPVSADAQWHLGSNTKAMTATLAGVLVEEGRLRWESTLGEVLGDAAPDMDPAHRDTTLAMLLHHTSGITANIDWFAAPEDRLACAAEILSSPPADQRGSHAYSNAGYVVAGAMMEAVTGKRWEDLMREKLFAPLGMMDSGFGAPSRPGAPWGHRDGLLGWKPVDPASRSADNAPVLGPAGTVHATLADYARFLAIHLKGARGQGGIVSADTFATLHTPPEGGDYAMGWIVTDRDWAGGRALTHGGSNTLWYATAWIAPEKNMAFFAVTNAGGDTGFEAADRAIEALLARNSIAPQDAPIDGDPPASASGDTTS